MKRIGMLVVGAAVVATVLSSARAAQQKTRPNIIVIVADDQGYADIGVQGCKDIPTPHIDSLAASGIRCTNGYVSGPYCSPTRAGLITGRYQQRFGHEFNPGPAQRAEDHMGLPLSEATLADRLKAAGYATGMVGKWHLGYADKLHPLKRGFDEFFGFLGGAHSYLDAKADSRNAIQRGTKAVDEQEYLTDAFAREAVAFVDRHRQHPFFLYYTFNAVHTPMEATEQYLDRFASIEDRRRRTYAAMTSAMDDAIGRLLKKLADTGLEENTLIFYVSDNGGPPVNGSSNGPLRGHKAQTLEGGIRVPFLVRWKGHLAEGKLYEHPVIQLDIAATALAAAGVEDLKAAKLDGVNLLPHLMAENHEPPHEALYWRMGPQMAIRMGNWKLVKHLDAEHAELYDLAADVGEKNNLAKDNPQKFQELQTAWNKWNSELAKPLWDAPSRRIGGRAAARARTNNQ